MSKSSVDTSTTEILIYKALNIKEAIEIRTRLVNESHGCWFFLYSQTSEIYATNEYGGRLTKEKVEELIVLSKKVVAELSAPTKTVGPPS